MGVREDCRHYSSRTSGDEVVQRCRLGVNEVAPFACPDDCVFLEGRSVSGTGWLVDDPEDADGPDDPGSAGSAGSSGPD
jgi:hypothetical protein